VHLATAPKSNAVYAAFGAAMRAAKETGSLTPPQNILNAPTTLMKQLGYGETAAECGFDDRPGIRWRET
ncbi:MAG: hypothetical protein HC805_03420, partial [Alkalinema sp. RL_2_19]|nr:hypothetical protein [Alkalinema sp. RL_2_19]